MAAGKFSSTVAAMLVTGTAFLVATISTIILKVSGQSLSFNKGDLTLPIMAGLFTGIAEIFYLSMFSKNAPLTIGNPLVVGGTVAVAVILGMFILREPINIVKVAGIGLVIVGLVLLSRS
jgi:multidrug transporter EmrE-like cation transporter